MNCLTRFLDWIDSAAPGDRSQDSRRQESPILPPKQAWDLPPKQACSSRKESSSWGMESSLGSMESSLPALFKTTLVHRQVPAPDVSSLSPNASEPVVDSGMVVPVSLPDVFQQEKQREEPQKKF